MRTLIQVRTTEDVKIKIQKQAEILNMSISQFLLKSVEDKKEFINIFEQFDKEFRNIKEKIDTSFYYLKEDTQEIQSIINEEKEDNKHYSTLDIPKEEISKTDLILIKGNVLEVLEHNKEEGYLLAINILNDKKLQLKYENLTDDLVVKRRS